MEGFTLHPLGQFELRELVEFGFGQRHTERYAGLMRLAFVLDGTTDQVGVVVRQDTTGVHGEVTADPHVDPEAVRRQVARVLSLDVDARPFDALCAADPVLSRVHALAPGLRPPLFYSPYEAAAWSVLSARRPALQMMAVRAELSRRHGRVFELAGEELAAFPTPDALLAVDAVPGLNADKVRRLHGVARAAKDGILDVDALSSLPPDEAMARVQVIEGIGPFYASLIVIRALATTDVLPTGEKLIAGVVGRLYDLDGPASDAQLGEIALAWRPFRTWASVLLRARGGRLLDGDLARSEAAR